MIDIFSSDEALARDLGQRLKIRRLNMNLTEQSVADNIGVSHTTYRKLERGEGKLITLIGAMRALGALDNLDSFLPVTAYSPMQMTKITRQFRKRGNQKLAPNKKDESSW